MKYNDDGSITFTLTKEQVKKYEKWAKKLPKIPDHYSGAVGGNFSFIFIPTGIGIWNGVTRADDPINNQLDLTEYEHW